MTGAGPPAERTTRVVVDARTVTGPYTGIGRYAASLVGAMATEAPDLQLELIVTASGRPVFEPIVPAGWTLTSTTMEIPRHPWSDLWMNVAVPWKLSRSGAPVYWSCANYLPFFSGGSRRVVTIHDMVPFRHPQADPWKFTTYLKFMLSQAIYVADLVVVVSRFTGDEVVKLMGTDHRRIRVVPNGVDAFFRPLDAQERCAGPAPHSCGVPYLLTVGVHIGRKNFVRLVRVLDRLRRRGHPHHLVIAGPPGPASAELASEVERLGLTDAVHTLGHVTDEQLRALYDGTDLFVYPSFYEGFGLPVLEAMACARPVAAAAASSIPEVAGEAAILFDPFSEDDIERACLAVLDNADRARTLAVAGPLRAAQFSWGAAARATAAVFRELV